MDNSKDFCVLFFGPKGRVDVVDQATTPESAFKKRAKVLGIPHVRPGSVKVFETSDLIAIGDTEVQVKEEAEAVSIH